MSEQSHRLVRITSAGGWCSCGHAYINAGGPVREQHRQHKAEVKPESVTTNFANAIRAAKGLTQPQMAAHDKRTWELYTECANLAGRAAQFRELVERTAAKLASDDVRERLSVTSNIDSLREELAKREAALEAGQAALDAHEKSYTGWARFWCVPGGHIHSSQDCSTCHPTTQFYLAHEVSGMDEAAAVKAQGPALCTVCFPSAPVEWTIGHEAARRAGNCPGSLKYADLSLPHRSGYCYGNWATCSECGATAALTTAGKIRSHKPKEA